MFQTNSPVSLALTNRVLTAALVNGLMANEHDGRRIEGDIVELTEWPEIVKSIFTSSTDPPDWARNNKAFEGVVGEAGLLAFCGFVEDIWVSHCIC